MKDDQSSFLYLIFGALTIGASLIVGFILFKSGIFQVSFRYEWGLLLVGTVYGISIFSVVALIYNWHKAPERAKVFQSHQMLTIANETLPFLRKSFSLETCDQVVQIIHQRTDADAVAITNNKVLLAFAGAGYEHHLPGSFIIPRDKKALEKEGFVIFTDKDNAGCPDLTEELEWTGVAVPLKVQDRFVGTLELLYLPPKRVTESRLTVAQGLGKLLSTQLGLAELDKQKELIFKSELKALRAQINPHFLFNTLNTIAALCRTDPDTARKLIIKFADFFRDSLERQKQFTTLEEELRYVDHYLTFEKARFGSSLVLTKEIEPETLKQKIPSLVLQPIVENCIKHGKSKTGKLTLTIKAFLNNGYLNLSVKDDGCGISKADLMKIKKMSASSKGLGIGLNNIRERLRSLYGSANLLKITSELEKGTEVYLKIPVSKKMASSKKREIAQLEQVQ